VSGLNSVTSKSATCGLRDERWENNIIARNRNGVRGTYVRVGASQVGHLEQLLRGQAQRGVRAAAQRVVHAGQHAAVHGDHHEGLRIGVAERRGVEACAAKQGLRLSNAVTY
jgi:hypothetical protein